MSDDLFSQLYIRPPTLLSDSDRARSRIGAQLIGFAGLLPSATLAQFVHEKVGVRVSAGTATWTAWDRFVQTCKIRDLLDSITLIGRFIGGHGGPQAAKQWFAEMRRIFSEEHLAYTIDEAGVVHFAVDQEFQRNRFSAVAGLQSPRYANVLDAFEKASDRLVEQPPNTKDAWRAVFAANEGLFKLMFPNSPRLTGAEIDRHLAPLVTNKHCSDDTALRAAQRLLRSFKEWVDASHNYRHEPGTQEPAQAPLDLAILAISQGTSFLRWLREFDSQAQ